MNYHNHKWILPSEDFNKNLPSCNKSPKMTFDQEGKERSKCIKIIHQAAAILKLPQTTIFVASVFFHRFYAKYAMQDYDTFTMSISCIFLASKVEETLKKLKELIPVMLKFRTNHSNEDDNKKLIDNVLHYERMLLQMLEFELDVNQPYHFVLSFSNTLQGKEPEANGIQESKIFAQTCWSFITDTLEIPICLFHDAPILAWGALSFAATIFEFDLDEKVGKSGFDKYYEAHYKEIKAAHKDIELFYVEKPTLEKIRERAKGLHSMS